MAFNLQNADVRENFKVAAHNIAAANGYFKTVNGRQVPDISKIDLEQLTQGYITTMCDVVPNNSLLTFPIVDTQNVSGGPNLSIMRLISMQDSFVIGSMSFYLMVYSYVTGSNQTQMDLTTSTFLTPITYASQFHNQNATVGPLMAAGLAQIWNGYLSLTIDKKVVIPYWDCQRHLYIPQQQATQNPSPVLTPTQWPINQDQYDGSTDGYYPVEPTIVLGGGRQNDLKLNLPANFPSSILPFTFSNYGNGASGSFIVKACVTFRGILAQNSTSVK